MNSQIIFIVFSAVLVGVFPSVSWAKPFSPLKKSYSRLSEKTFAQLDSAQIVEDLWKAMLANPYDPEFEEYLRASVGEWTLSSVDRVKVAAVQDALKHIRNLSDRQRYYLDKNDELKKVILSEGVLQGDLDIYMDQMVKDASESPAATPYFLRDGSSWEHLRKMLDDERFVLERNVAHLERQHRGLARLHQHKTFGRQPVSSAVVIVNDPALLSSSNVAYRAEEALNSDRILRSAPSSMVDLQRQVMSLREDVLQKDALINVLRAQVVEVSLSLAQKDRVLNERMGELAELRKQMDDVQARFDLGQKIIQEKDIQIESIQKELSYVKEEMKTRLADKDRQMDEMAGMLDVYWKKLNLQSERVDKKEDDSKFLMERLLSLNDVLEEKEIILERTHRDLDDFEGRLKEIKAKTNAVSEGEGVSAGQELLDLEMKLTGVKNYLIQQLEENDALSRYLSREQNQLGASLQPELTP